MERERMSFNVDYRGWIDRRRRSFEDVKGLLDCDGREKFTKWAESSFYGAKTKICGVNIELVPSDYEISQRCRFFINS